MNDAHLHLTVNHFPLIGVIIALVILFVGIVKDNNSIKNTANILLIACGILTYLSMYTGEGAEEIVEDMPTIGHQIIHEHEELAEKFAILMYVISGLSLLSFFANMKHHKFAKILSYITLLFVIGAAVFSKFVGTSGGEIRHTEIRETTTQIIDKQKEANDNKDEN